MSSAPRRLAIIALVPLLATLLGLGSAGCNSDDDENNQGVPTTVVIPSFSNAITVNNQSPGEDDTVTVASVSLDEPGYIVVREALPTRPDFPGALIGLLPVSGSGRDIEVPLDRSPLPGERLFATLHVESNDTASFDFDQTPGIDPPALDDQGRPASASFTVEPSSGLIIATDQSVAHPVWIETVSIQAVDTTAQRGFLAIHTSLEDLSDPIGAVALTALVSRDVEVVLNRPALHDTQLYAVLHQDLGVQGIFEPGVDLPLMDAGSGAITSASFTVTLDPAPDAQISCVATRSVCDAPSTTLPIDVSIQADHPGALLVRYTDTNGEARAALYPVEQGASMQSGLMLPEAACHTRFEVSLLVDIEGVDPLDAPVLPYATSDEGLPAVCSVGVQRELVGELSVDPADVLAMTSTLTGFVRLPGAAAFIAVYATDDTGQRTDLLGVARQTQAEQDLAIELSRPLLRGETVLVNAYTDEGERGVFEPDEADKQVLAFGPLESEAGELAQYVSSSQTIDDLGTSQAFITVLDQAPELADVITVRQTIADADALVVVFEDDAGRPGAPLGFSPVTAGVVQDIEVMLSRDAVVGERLHVWLLEDDGNQSYDDIFTDPVFVRDAAPVMQIIEVEAAP